jgi:hypothetical protein
MDTQESTDREADVLNRLVRQLRDINSALVDEMCRPTDLKSLLFQAAALLQQAHIKAIAAKSNAVEEIVDARDCVEAALVWFGGKAAPRQSHTHPNHER